MESKFHSEPRVIALDLSDYAAILAFPIGRQAIQYLIACAFEENTQAIFMHEDKRFSFRGNVGLAPKWEHRALTGSEERWVSACIYALTNVHGKHIEVSLRGTHPRLVSEVLTKHEIRNFTLHEGGFFGNLFAPRSPAYVCIGDGVIEKPRAQVLRDRVCVYPASHLGPNNEPTSECGFIVTGPCVTSSSYIVHGIRYEEVVHVYLRPGE